MKIQLISIISTFIILFSACHQLELRPKERELPNYLKERGTFYFNENPKVIAKNCKEVPELAYMIHKKFKTQDSFRLMVYLNNEIYKEIKNDFWKKIRNYKENDGKISDALELPIYSSIENDTINLRVEYFYKDWLIEEEEIKILYLEDGQIAQVFDYKYFNTGNVCELPTPFQNSDLHPIPHEGKYDIIEKTVFRTEKISDDQKMTIVDYGNTYLQSKTSGIKIPIPKKEKNDTFFHPAGFKIKEGAVTANKYLYYNFDEEMIGKYPAIHLVESGVALYKTVEVNECKLITGDEFCVYKPTEIMYGFIDYPDSISNNYYSVLDNKNW